MQDHHGKASPVTVSRISVVGLGFVGLSLAVANARTGFETIGIDIDAKKVDSLNSGRPDFFEPGMEAMLADSIRHKKIRFTTDLDHAVQNSEITFLAVGTPPRGGRRGVDLSHIRGAVEQIASSLEKKDAFHLLAIKSSLPPMTTGTFILPTLRHLMERGRADVVVNPEFLREGSAIADILRPHLIVIGSNGGRGGQFLEKYYRDFYTKPPEIMHTGIATAEVIKYANNAFLATKISFINSIGALCQGIPGADVETVARAIGRDSRIGPLFLRAGPGFGGSCLPKDLAGLIDISREIGARPVLFEAVRDVNERQFMTIMDMMGEQNVLAEDKTVAILGAAFKGGTDDVREAVSVRVVEKLLECKMTVRVHDPMALKNFKRLFGARIAYCTSVGRCLEGSDCCIILTDWDEYRGLKPKDFLKWMGSCNVVDARRILNPKEFEGTGFRAIGLGV